MYCTVTATKYPPGVRQSNGNLWIFTNRKLIINSNGNELYSQPTTSKMANRRHHFLEMWYSTSSRRTWLSVKQRLSESIWQMRWIPILTIFRPLDLLPRTLISALAFSILQILSFREIKWFSNEEKFRWLFSLLSTSFSNKSMVTNMSERSKAIITTHTADTVIVDVMKMEFAYSTNVLASWIRNIQFPSTFVVWITMAKRNFKLNKFWCGFMPIIANDLWPDRISFIVNF